MAVRLAASTHASIYAGAVLFTIARVAGRTAHFLEELAERPLRFRFRAVYAVGRPETSSGFEA